MRTEKQDGHSIFSLLEKEAAPKIKSRKVLLLLGLFLLVAVPVEAQCAMCRAALESEADNSQAEGINNGIVYLMAVPYLLVGGLFYLIYRKIKG